MLERFSLETRFPPNNWKDPQWISSYLAKVERTATSACAARVSTLATRNNGAYAKPTPQDWGCNWVSVVLSHISNKCNDNSPHPRVLRFQSDFSRLHDSAVELESNGVPDCEIFAWFRREFTKVFSIVLPEELTGALLQMQVPEGTLWEYAHHAVRTAIQISYDAHPDAPGERGIDYQRRTALTEFLRKQFPPLHAALLSLPDYKTCTTAELLETLKQYDTTWYAAGPLRFPDLPVLPTARYGDPNAPKLHQHPKHERRSHDTFSDPVYAIDDTDKAPTGRAAYTKHLIKDDDGTCSNCLKKKHFWGWCKMNFNAENCAARRAAGKAAPRDERHFKRVVKNIKEMNKPNPLARQRKADSSDEVNVLCDSSAPPSPTESTITGEIELFSITSEHATPTALTSLETAHVQTAIAHLTSEPHAPPHVCSTLTTDSNRTVDALIAHPVWPTAQQTNISSRNEDTVPPTCDTDTPYDAAGYVPAALTHTDWRSHPSAIAWLAHLADEAADRMASHATHTRARARAARAHAPARAHARQARAQNKKIHRICA
jgi:hypothetical protein